VIIHYGFLPKGIPGLRVRYTCSLNRVNPADLIGLFWKIQFTGAYKDQ
jgi:hypothetical protein